MTSHLRSGLVCVAAVAMVAALAGDALGRGGGGGGRGGGGGGARGGGGFSGGGSVRYSGGAASSRPSYSSSSAASRTPSASPRAASAVDSRSQVGERPRDVVGVVGETRPAAGVVEPARTREAAGTYAGSTYRPANAGSIAHPGAALVAGSVVAGGVAGSVGARQVTEGPGGAVGGSWTGPGGATIGGIRGPEGGAVVGVKTPDGSTRWVASLPDGANEIHHGGAIYWHHGHHYYYPYWYGESWYYAPIAPPTGVYWEELPSGYEPVVISNETYYASTDGVYVVRDDGKYRVVEPPAGSGVDPEPLGILRRMSDHVAKEMDFTLTARETTEEVLETGAKAQFESTRTIHVRRPDKLAAETLSPRGNRRTLFDRGTLVVYDLGKKSYATFDMPATIDGMLDAAAEQYGIAFLLGDLLYAQSYVRLTTAVQNARYVGLSVSPANCHHLAFSQDTIDWEIWVDAGATPLPRKLLVTYKTLPGSPRYEAVVSNWDSSANADSVFGLAIPAGVTKVVVNTPTPKAATGPK